MSLYIADEGSPFSPSSLSQIETTGPTCIQKMELLPLVTGEAIMKHLLLSAILGLGSLSVDAASIYKQSLSQKTNTYARSGVFMGGRAETLQSLMKVRRTYSAKVGLERVIMDLGSSDLRPLSEPGYFHVSVDGSNSRVIIQLSQLSKTLTNEQQLRKVFASSANVKSVEFTVDPQDSTGTFVLNLKRPMKAEVFSLSGRKKKTARLVLDLKPLVKR